MKNLFRRLLPLLLALLLVAPAALADPSIQEMGEALVHQQGILDEALAALAEIDERVASLEKQYAKNEDDLDLQDALLMAMIDQEEAAAEAQQALEDAVALRAEHAALVDANPDCEALTLEHEGQYAELLITVVLDGDLVIHDIACGVDGGARDQAVGEYGFLYQFIGKALPLSIGTGPQDDIRPAEGASRTSEDIVAALNALVYVEEEEQPPQGPITDPQGIADYIFRYGRLPDNFITKKEAQALGWDSSYNYVGDVAPGMSIGGDRFGNYEGLLPEKKGRTWYEADCYYEGRKRNAHRILYSSDGLVYYTDDHYETFTQMFPSWE